MPATAARLVTWSPTPPRAMSGVPCVSAICTDSPERPQNAPMSYAGRFRSPPRNPYPLTLQYTRWGMARDGGLGFEVEFVDRVRTEIGDEHVCRRQQAFELRTVVAVTQIEHDAALAPVVEGEGRVRHVVADAE